MNLEDNNNSSKPKNNLKIHILPNALPKKYLKDVLALCVKNNFPIQDTFSLNETDVLVSNLELDEILKILRINTLDSIKNEMYFVKLNWLTDCNKKGFLCDFTDQQYSIRKKKAEQTKDRQLNKYFTVASYECQRKTPNHHFNENLTDSLEILEKNAEFKASEHDLLKALAFRRAISVIKCFPTKITEICQLKNLKNIGEHISTILKDLLDGHSMEINNIKSSEYYQTMKDLTSIYGCGIAIANRLYKLGYKNVQSLRYHYAAINSKLHGEVERLKYGITYFNDLTINKITLDESKNLFEMLKDLILNEIDQQCHVELVGGFRRGKLEGHDLDVLISHPKLGEESFILKRLVEILDSKGLTVTGKYNRKSDHDWTKSTSHRDHFETFISILKFPIFKDSKKIKTNSESENDLNKVLESLDANKFHRDWIARRCDLIICSIDELPFAVLAWTGSRQFNRSIRLYSDKEFNYKLSAHGLFDNKIKTSFQLKTEKEIFETLKLDYVEPEMRCC